MNFQNPEPLGHWFGNDNEMNIASWSGAIARWICVFLTLGVRFFAIKRSRF